MTPKKTTTDSEYTIFVGRGFFQERRILSDKLKREASEFRKRNAIAVVACDLEKKNVIQECCLSCLKAHLIKKAEEWDLYKDLDNVLFMMAGCETGHYGYYLDEGKLIKI